MGLNFVPKLTDKEIKDILIHIFHESIAFFFDMFHLSYIIYEFEYSIYYGFIYSIYKKTFLCSGG